MLAQVIAFSVFAFKRAYPVAEATGVKLWVLAPVGGVPQIQRLLLPGQWQEVAIHQRPTF